MQELHNIIQGAARPRYQRILHRAVQAHRTVHITMMASLAAVLACGGQAT